MRHDPRMATSDELKDAILTNATEGIASASVGGQTVQSMSIGDQIKAANFAAGQNAKDTKSFGLRFTKLIPPGGG
jgi:hypothetical protein